MRKPIASLEWLLSRPCTGGKRAEQAAKVFCMPRIGDNELRVMYLKRMGYGFKSIAKDVKVEPTTIRNWLLRAGFTCDSGSKSPARAKANEVLRIKFSPKWATKFRNRTSWNNEWRGVVDQYPLGVNALKPWGTRNPKAAIASRKRYELLKHDPLFRMVRNVRTRVANTIRRQGLIKDDKTLALLGCSWDEYTTHIFNQLALGMTWGNFGAWHIDHIVPINTFDLSCPIQRSQAFHWSNTRPLWASENLARPKDGSDLTKKRPTNALRMTIPLPVARRLPSKSKLVG